MEQIGGLRAERRVLAKAGPQRTLSRRPLEVHTLRVRVHVVTASGRRRTGGDVAEAMHVVHVAQVVRMLVELREEVHLLVAKTRRHPSGAFRNSGKKLMFIKSNIIHRDIINHIY